MSAATATMMMPLPTRSGSSPARRASQVRSRYATARPSAYPRPYQPMASGPMVRAMGSGVASNILRSVAAGGGGRPAPVSFAAVNTEFNWWLLIVGLAIGAGLVWLVLLDSRRREDEVTAAERATESVWLADLLADAGTPLSPAVVRRVLDLHGEYLAMAPPAAGVEAASRPAGEPPDLAAVTRP